MAYLCAGRGDALHATRGRSSTPASSAGPTARTSCPPPTRSPAQAADTEIAFLNFDGITYGKGASVLKQLVKYHRAWTPSAMACALYFRRHAWGNATLADFLACLEDGSGRASRSGRGCGSRRPPSTPSPRNGRLTANASRDLTLSQTALAGIPDVIRPHHLEVGLLRNDGGRFDRHRSPREHPRRRSRGARGRRPAPARHRLP